MSRSIDLEALYQNLVFFLPMQEGGGVLVQDVALPHHPMTMGGSPDWTMLSSGIQVLDFDGSSDFLSGTAATTGDLNYTSQSFSGCAWVNPDTTATMVFLGKGDNASAGWLVYVTGGYLGVETVSGAGSLRDSYSAVGTVVAGNWHLLGWTRSGTSIRVYIQGRDATAVAASHTTWASSSAKTFCVGQMSNDTLRFDGKLTLPCIWSRALAPAEHLELFNRERDWFGV